MPDPDLEMVCAGGGGVGVGRSAKNFFRSKNKGGSGPPGSAAGGDAPLRNGGSGGCAFPAPPSISAPGLYAQAHMTSYSC